VLFLPLAPLVVWIPLSADIYFWNLNHALVGSPEHAIAPNLFRFGIKVVQASKKIETFSVAGPKIDPKLQDIEKKVLFYPLLPPVVWSLISANIYFCNPEM
jgi:hypothetical protein